MILRDCASVFAFEKHVPFLTPALMSSAENLYGSDLMETFFSRIDASDMKEFASCEFIFNFTMKTFHFTPTSPFINVVLSPFL